MSRRQAAAAAALAACVLAAFFYFGRTPAADAPFQPDQTPEPAPNFALPDLAGKKIPLSSFRGRAVLVAFWATWCHPCLEELPELKRLHESYTARGFSILAVSMDHDPSDVAAFVREQGIPYPVVLAMGEPPEGYDFPGIPASFLISPEGSIVRRYLGSESYSVLSRDVEEALHLVK